MGPAMRQLSRHATVKRRRCDVGLSIVYWGVRPFTCECAAWLRIHNRGGQSRSGFWSVSIGVMVNLHGNSVRWYSSMSTTRAAGEKIGLSHTREECGRYQGNAITLDVAGLKRPVSPCTRNCLQYHLTIARLL